MHMATISRWTLPYFGSALAALVLALALMAVGFGYPFDGLLAPQTLVVVHLVAIGWLSLLVLGALLQFLPVLIGRELAWQSLPPVVLGLILAGLALLVCGFLALDGWHAEWTDLLPFGGILLLAGFCVAALILLATVMRASSVPLSAGLVALGLMSLLVAALLGETFASILTGLIGGEFAIALIEHGVGLHAAFGLGGWLTLAAMGVSYRLVSMFLIAPERNGMLSRLAFWCGTVTLGALVGVLFVLIGANDVWLPGLALAGLAAVLAIGAYLADMAILYRTRRRTALELHMRGAATAMGMLGLGLCLLVWALWSGAERALAASVHILALGWLSGLGLAMLYKIVPFLTWLECFAPQMGRTLTPRVQDLVCERRAGPIFGLYFAGELAGAGAILFGAGPLFQLAAAVQVMSVLLLAHQLVRARLLAELPEPWLAHPRPRLLWPSTRQRSLA